MKTTFLFISALSIAGTVDAYSTMGAFGTRRSTMTMKRAAGGRGGKKNINEALGNKQSGMASGSSPASAPPGLASKQWIQTPVSSKEIGKAQEGKVELFDTNVPALQDKLTNPTGAVSVLKQNGETFCFSSSCPSCKIPLSKATVLPATSSRSSPGVVCTFCKSAYDLKSGQKLAVSPAEAGGGMFAGLAQGLFKASGNTNPLPMYQLGEKGGKLLISID